jgi:hypothetical protein
MMIWDKGGYDGRDMWHVLRKKLMQSFVEIRGKRRLGRPGCR